MSRLPSFAATIEHAFAVDTKSLHQWVVAFCAIRFDNEQGQLIEECYPPGCLSQSDEVAIAFSSFPDSVSWHHNSPSIHDCIFFFRYRRVVNSESQSLSCNIAEADVDDESPRRHAGGNTTCAHSEEGTDARFVYGYVFNRQRHDEKLKRGGEQKSVVVLSGSPYTNVFRPLLQIIGPMYFEVGKNAFEQMAACISSWPSPAPGKGMELPVGNETLRISIPPLYSVPEKGGMVFKHSFFAHSLFSTSFSDGIFHDFDIFGSFKGLLMQLWMLWELLIIGEPILIIAPAPHQCSEAVASLVSLVVPFFYTVDFRPYFTIHDLEFEKLNSIHESDAFPPAIIGVTNLLFLKALHRIPHVVSVGTALTYSNHFSSSVARSLTGKSTSSPGGLGFHYHTLMRLSPTRLLRSVKLRREGPMSLMTEYKEAVWSAYSAIIKPDTSVLNRLVDVGMSLKMAESMTLANNDILRRHFFELMLNFLSPFGPYFRVSSPSKNSSPFVDPPPLLPFYPDKFLEDLMTRGPGKFLLKRMKSNWLELYRRFLEGRHFKPWFQMKRASAELEQQSIWRKARMSSDIHQFICKMSELEIVDSFNAIEKHLHEEIKRCGNSEWRITTEKLKRDLQMLLEVLPKDTQQLLLSNPQTASLLLH